MPVNAPMQASREKVGGEDIILFEIEMEEIDEHE